MRKRLHNENDCIDNKEYFNLQEITEKFLKYASKINLISIFYKSFICFLKTRMEMNKMLKLQIISY